MKLVLLLSLFLLTGGNLFSSTAPIFFVLARWSGDHSPGRNEQTAHGSACVPGRAGRPGSGP